ncbi:MAG TPA: RsmD family RNA methyltransferase [Phycisphaerae bacterium]|nr:RsmD family RNA methyltransferase [Phycisphaerae bacterium]
MRIASGEFRGRRLLGPVGADVTRPMTDRVKIALFNILGGSLAEAVVLDLFAGTGSLGLEALSRGARLACFAEQHRTALERLRRNIEALGVADRCRIWGGDILQSLPRRLAELGEPADIAFVDPPYRLSAGWDWEEITPRLFAPLAGGLSPEGVVMLRCERNIAVPEALGPLGVRDRRDYGKMSLVFLAR